MSVNSLQTDMFTDMFTDTDMLTDMFKDMFTDVMLSSKNCLVPSVLLVVEGQCVICKQPSVLHPKPHPTSPGHM